MPHILFQNANILVPSGRADDYVVTLRHHSLLIKDNKIAQIAPQVISPEEAQVIDFTNKIIFRGSGWMPRSLECWNDDRGRPCDIKVTRAPLAFPLFQALTELLC